MKKTTKCGKCGKIIKSIFAYECIECGKDFCDDCWMSIGHFQAEYCPECINNIICPHCGRTFTTTNN